MPIFDPASLQRALAATQPAIVEQAQPQDQGIGPAPYLSLFAGQGADAASSLYKLQHGYDESNPIYGSKPTPARIIGTKAALSLPLALLMRHLSNTDHPTAAKLIGYLGGIEGAVPAAINLSKPNLK